MRVNPTALAPLGLLFFAACITPPPPPGAGSPQYERDDRYRVDPRDGYRVPDDYTPSRDQGNGYYDRSDPYRPPEQPPGDYNPAAKGRVSFLLGQRSFADSDFEPVDEPVTFGIELSQVPGDGGLGFEFGIGFGLDSEEDFFLPGQGVVDAQVNTAEIYVGLRTEFGTGTFRPYVAGGGTLMRAERRIDQGFLSVTEQDSALGLYLHGGVQADITDTLFLGVDFRRVFGTEYEFDSGDFDGDYSQLSLVIGLSI